MTTTRTSSSSRVRGATLALLTGAGLALTPLAASVAVAPPAAAAPVMFSAAPAPTPTTQAAVNHALAQQGKPYVYGGTGPGGFDCSGLTFAAYKAAGVQLPRTSRAQATAGVEVPWYAMQPGDLITFYDPVGHVGMAIGNGMMVHSSTYGKPVSIVRVDSVPGYHSTRRVA
ncbi:C40 family peptidase [Blastococcus sp. TML/M2B]|uniref:C40 family peptidase n=1 Tax=unclassified Blastococcus TaxID=2619396 RepID=UPI0019098EEB|nr:MULTISPECIES: C40 family peptidase [unclassified Blastococcus]MBN1093309.1 C40 family peptidase [Blastococcus sp. TML/M2B]MBN1096577.1 C40 family peptidase [Blastococcus sp. TML/C7B]